MKLRKIYFPVYLIKIEFMLTNKVSHRSLKLATHWISLRSWHLDKVSHRWFDQLDSTLKLICPCNSFVEKFGYTYNIILNVMYINWSLKYCLISQFFMEKLKDAFSSETRSGRELSYKQKFYVFINTWIWIYPKQFSLSLGKMVTTVSV